MSYPGTNDLITTAEVKALTNITASTYDGFITGIIPTIRGAIESYCRRRFLLNTWIQWCQLEREILTDNWPINNIMMVGVPWSAVLINDTNYIYNFNITQPSSDNPYIDSKFTATNTQTFIATDFLFSTYPTLGALKTAVESALTGVTFTYQNPPPTMADFSGISTLSLRPTSGKTIFAGINYFDQATNTMLGDVYRISDLSDRLLFNPNFIVGSNLYTGNYCGPYQSGYNNIDSGNWATDWYSIQDTMIIYSSGYTTALVPLELKWIAANIIIDLMNVMDMFSSNISKSIYDSEKLGDYSYKLATTANLPLIIERYAAQLDIFKKKII
jgi:hypothetical protein